MAGLTAAFELTRTEPLRERFDVTVYQLGWRLGGKCASGVDEHGRNIEHGLHIWFGYYENTFALLKAAYDEWQPPTGQKITKLREAIVAQPLTLIGDGDKTDPGWYEAAFPTNGSRPGHGEVDIGTWPSLVRIVELLAHFAGRKVRADAALAALPLVVDVTANLEGIALFARGVDGRHAPYARQDLEAVVAKLRRLGAAVRLAEAPARRDDAQLWQQIDVVAAFASGIVNDVLLGQTPIAELDRSDFREWLVRHGADFQSAHRSPFVRALYDTMFQYPDGDPSRPLYGAGTAAQVVLRMLGTYAGHLAWKPAAGTGSAVIAPLYSVLKSRGVAFRFFHKLVHVELAADEDAVDALRFDRQVDLVDPGREYCPVATRSGLLSFGAEPDWSVIKDEARIKAASVDLESHWSHERVGCVTLNRGSCFDDVVLALPLGAFKRLNADDGPCLQLMKRSRAFRSMTERQHLVPSVSVQIRTTRSLAPGSPAGVSGPHPLGIWADMSGDLSDDASARAQGAPSALYYLCDVLHSGDYRARIRDTGTPGRARKQARALIERWFDNQAPSIWKGVGTRGCFDWNVLVGGSESVGSARLGGQVIRPNIDPAGCCVSSAPGTTASRLKCDESGFGHLYLAGSWIDTGFNTECIEAAVMSGMQVARAITGDAREIAGEGFLHPEHEEVSVCEAFGDGIRWLAGLG